MSQPASADERALVWQLRCNVISRFDTFCNAMKKNKNPLHFPQQLEAFQTARRAKEVNEIYTFDRMKEGLKQRHMTITQRMDKLQQKALRNKLEQAGEPDGELLQEQAMMLEELVEFGRQAHDAQIDAPDNEFDTIAGLQGFNYHAPDNDHQPLKQLPEAHSDLFDHELNALTEQELQKELEQNEKTIQESLKKPGRLELSVEPTAPAAEPEPQPAPVEPEEEELDFESLQSVSEAEPEILEFFEQEEHEREEQKSAPENTPPEGGLLYFRSLPPLDGSEVQKTQEEEAAPKNKPTGKSLFFFRTPSDE